MNELRFGICGLGLMGRNYLARLARNPRARVAAVCDRNAQRRNGDWTGGAGNLDALAGPRPPVDFSQINCCATIEALVADPQIDAVAITLPTALHADAAVAALQAGKHVLCEKPMALSVRAAERMLREARKAKRTLMIAQCIRFWPQYETIERIVREGRIGPVRCATLRRLAAAPLYSDEGWLLSADLSGGALLDLHIHDVDFVQHLLGVPDEIAARGQVGASGGVDHVAALFHWNDGRYAALEGGWTMSPPWPFEMAITVHGERGTLEWSLTRGADVLLYDGGREPQRIACAGDAYEREIAYFVDCVCDQRPTDRCLPESAMASLALVELERRAMDTGRVTRVPARLRTSGA